MFFPEYSFHINFTKKQEISAKLNDSVKSYNKKTKREGAGVGMRRGELANRHCGFGHIY